MVSARCDGRDEATQKSKRGEAGADDVRVQEGILPRWRMVRGLWQRCETDRNERDPDERGIYFQCGSQEPGQGTSMWASGRPKGQCRRPCVGLHDSLARTQVKKSRRGSNSRKRPISRREHEEKQQFDNREPSSMRGWVSYDAVQVHKAVESRQTFEARKEG